MHKKFIKKLFIVAMALTMVFAMSATSFAATGTATVKFCAPGGMYDGSGYTYPSYYVFDDTIGWSTYALPIDLSTITGLDSEITLPAGFAGQYNNDPTAEYVPTAFDLFYKAIKTAGESRASEGSPNAANCLFNYGFDTFNTPNGIYMSKIVGLATDEIQSQYSSVPGGSYWSGYSWSFYAVPDTVTDFDITDPDEAYKSWFYANNVAAQNGYTYYMIYEYNEVTW